MDIQQNINAAEIVSCQGVNDHLTQDDVIVEFLKNNYAMKDQNPVDGIKFFSKQNHSGKNDTIGDPKLVTFLLSWFFYRPLTDMTTSTHVSRIKFAASYHIPKEKVSSLIPSEFQENIIRVFARDPSKVRAVHEAFRRLMSRFYRTSDGSSNLPPSSTSPYYDSRNTTPEKASSNVALTWLQSRQASPTRSVGSGSKRRLRSSSPSPARPLKSAGSKFMGDGVMDISDDEN